MTIRSTLVLTTMLALAVPFRAQAQSPHDGKPKAKVELLSAVDGVVAGEPFEVGLHFKIVQPWHIYWQNSGESGQPPRIQWTLPPGFVAEAFRFPVPKRHTDPSGFITTNILDGNPTLLVRISPPATISTDQVTLSGDLKYLICDEICLQESAKVELSLPVRASAEAVKPANVKIFETARAALPSTNSKHVAISATVKPAADQLKPGATFELLVTVRVADGYRVLAHDAGTKQAAAVDLFVERIPGVYFDPTEYPAGAPRSDAQRGRLNEHAGTFTLRVPGEIDADVRPPFSFGGVLKYQACDTSGACAAPEALAWSYNPFERAGEVPGSASDGSRRVQAAQPGDSAAIAAIDQPSVDDRDGLDYEPTDSDEEDAIASSALDGAPVSGANGAVLASDLDFDEGPGTTNSFLYWLGLALLGGLILNIMPCVLPVISIKVLSFVQQSREDRGRVIKLGLTFCLGMLISFWALAGVVIALKSTGEELGWGFQFQSPRFVIAMMALMFVFGLSLLGVYHITLPGATVSKLSAAEEREGLTGAFMKGVLGTILATPCTAPYLGPALGVAFQSSNGELLAIFTAVGVGMASPFAILSINPNWLKFLPRPGAWMEHFKQFMGFLLMGTVVWLMFTLGAQIGVPGLARTAGFLVILGFACWLLGRQTPFTPTGRRLLAWVTAIVVSVGAWWFSFERTVTVENMVEQVRLAKVCPCETEIPAIAAEDWKRQIPWQVWSKGRPEYLASQGYTVYVDYTATWCATCQANKVATLETERVRGLMRDQCVVPIKADFTLEDSDILTDLHRFGRSGVPLNVIYPAGKPESPIVMPEQLVGRVSLVVDRLLQAGPTFACSRTPSSDVTGQASLRMRGVHEATSLGLTK